MKLAQTILAAALLAATSAISQPTPPPAPQTVPAPAAQAAPEQQQNPDQTPNPDGQIFTLPTVRVNLVNLVFTVTDKHGRFITGLQRQNFALLDDGRPPTSVVSFTQQTNLPLRIGVMLDTSSSIRTRFKFEQDAALDFFLQILHVKDKAFVEGFDIDTFTPQDFTSNVDKLNVGIHKLRPGGGTALFDSLYKTCRDQMLTLKENEPVRKAIILVSDGDDNYSRSLESDAIKMCQRAETTVYAISTDTSPTRGKGGEVLKTITEATGGQVFFPIKLEDVNEGFQKIEEELRSQYNLEYRPAGFKQDGSFRTIYLFAKGYNVRVKKGYFATKAPNSVPNAALPRETMPIFAPNVTAKPVAQEVSSNEQQIPFRVQVLDGRSGKPLANQRLLVFTGSSDAAAKSHAEHALLTTDRNGFSVLPQQPDDARFVQMFANGKVACFPKPNEVTFNLREVATRGVITPDSCSARAQRPRRPPEPSSIMLGRQSSWKE